MSDMLSERWNALCESDPLSHELCECSCFVNFQRFKIKPDSFVDFVRFSRPRFNEISLIMLQSSLCLDIGVENRCAIDGSCDLMDRKVMY